MDAIRRRFSPLAYFYVILFFALAAFLPVWVFFRDGVGASLLSPYRMASLLWPGFVAGCFWYASLRCSHDKLPYRDGLLYIAASMIAGTMYMSFFLVLPVLLAAFSASVGIALYGDIRRDVTYAPAKWSRVVRYFYRNRMVQ